MENQGAGYTYRSRFRPQAVPHGIMQTVTRVPGQVPVYSTNRYPTSLVGKQSTVSRDNHFPALMKIKRSPNAHTNSRRAASAIDIGGNFLTIDNKVSLSHRNFTSISTSGYTTRAYSGPLIPTGTSNVLANSAYWPVVAVPTDDQLYVLGTTAIARCEPTNPNANLATAIAEVVREGMPELAGAELKRLMKSIREYRNPLSSKKRYIETPQVGRRVGSEYLNYQFGIRPIVADVLKFAEAVIKSDQIMRQYDRDSGRQIRRSYHFPTETSVQDVPLTGATNVAVYPTLPTVMYNGSGYLGTLTKTRKRTVEVWFSGAFMYKVPYSTIQGRTVFARDVTRARKLLGLQITPEVLWNLAPWSWFVDWFITSSDVVHNATAFATDKLVMKYGYLMYKETIEDTYTHSGVYLKSGPSGEISMTFSTVLKRRVKAHPYGFGVKDTDLSAYQLSILAALGLANGRT